MSWCLLSLPHLCSLWLPTRATSDDGNDDDDKEAPYDDVSDDDGYGGKHEYKIYL